MELYLTVSIWVKSFIWALIFALFEWWKVLDKFHDCSSSLVKKRDPNLMLSFRPRLSHIYDSGGQILTNRLNLLGLYYLSKRIRVRLVCTWRSIICQRTMSIVGRVNLLTLPWVDQNYCRKWSFARYLYKLNVDSDFSLGFWQEPSIGIRCRLEVTVGQH